MTNSTVSKKKGPLRTEAIISILILLLVGFVFARFFFDKSLEQGLEWTGTQVHGAEVNIGSLKTSFINARIDIRDIQVTDKNNPENNLIQIGSISFALLWDALLRAKIVVNEASIEGVEIQKKRSKKGYIVPPDTSENTTLKVMNKKIMEHTKDEFDGNVLGDIAEVAEGKNMLEQVGDVKETLESEKKITELESLLNEKEIEWKKRLESLKQLDELKDLQKKIKSVKVDKKRPWKSLKEFKALGKSVKGKVKEYKSSSKSLRTDLETFKNGFKEIEILAKKDLQALQKHFSLPDLDPKAFSKGLFGKMIREKMGDSFKYVAMAREYLPPKKDERAEEEVIAPRKRGEGKTYAFPITTGYPLFWWKKGAFSSKTEQGELQAEVKDITNDPSYLKLPATLDFKGDFPSLNLRGLMGKGKFDHTAEVAKDDLTLAISSYPIQSYELLSSEKLKFALKDGLGKWSLNLKMIDSQVRFSLQGIFTKLNYDIQCKQKIVKRIFTRASQNTPAIKVNALAVGQWDKLDWDIDSNLGTALSRGIRGELQAVIDKQKLALENKIENKIAPKMEKLNQKYGDIKGKLNKLLGDKENEINKLGKNSLSAIDKSSSQKNTVKKVKTKAKKKLKSLFKKIKL